MMIQTEGSENKRASDAARMQHLALVFSLLAVATTVIHAGAAWLASKALAELPRHEQSTAIRQKLLKFKFVQTRNALTMATMSMAV